MGKIKYAYSLELHKIMTASEAHEAWVMGIISDKTKFKCCCPACSARITCANMDKPQWQMKEREHFKAVTEHSENCTEMTQNHIDQKKVQGEFKEAPRIGDEIIFHVGRPKKHGEIDIIQNTDYKKVKTVSAGTVSMVGKDKETHQRKSNLYLLSTLVGVFIDAKRHNELNTKRIPLDYYGKIYEYSLSTLFNKIGTVSINKEEAWKAKVYYGKAVIKKDDKNQYWINYCDKFKNSDLIVKCLIKKEIIDNTYNKTGSINIIERFLDKESYCFLLGKVKITKHTIYINIKSLDHIACSFDDV